MILKTLWVQTQASTLNHLPIIIPARWMEAQVSLLSFALAICQEWSEEEQVRICEHISMMRLGLRVGAQGSWLYDSMILIGVCGGLAEAEASACRSPSLVIAELWMEALVLVRWL